MDKESNLVSEFRGSVLANYESFIDRHSDLNKYVQQHPLNIPPKISYLIEQLDKYKNYLNPTSSIVNYIKDNYESLNGKQLEENTTCPIVAYKYIEEILLSIRDKTGEIPVNTILGTMLSKGIVSALPMLVTSKATILMKLDVLTDMLKEALTLE